MTPADARRPLPAHQMRRGRRKEEAEPAMAERHRTGRAGMAASLRTDHKRYVA